MTTFLDSSGRNACAMRRMLVDGLLEIHFGVIGILMVSGFSLVPFEVEWGWTATMGIAVLQVALGFLLLWANKKLKATYVFPRSGYVVFRQSESEAWKQTWIACVGLIAFVALILVSEVNFPGLSDRIWHLSGPLSALVVTGAFVWVGIYLRLPHLNWLAGVSLVLGAVTYIAEAKLSGQLWVELGVSAALVVSGTVRFRSFLKTHPVIQEEEL